MLNGNSIELPLPVLLSVLLLDFIGRELLLGIVRARV
jgi:hypothetical protein